MEQTLELVFKTAEGDTKVITVTDPRTDITAEEANQAMETILAANVIETNGGDLAEIVEARMRVTQVTVLKQPHNEQIPAHNFVNGDLLHTLNILLHSNYDSHGHSKHNQGTAHHRSQCHFCHNNL